MEFETNHRNSKCRAKCCAIGCNSKMNVNTNLSFHKLPKSGLKMELVNSFGEKEIVVRRSEWLRSLGLETCNKSAVVCSKHFDPSDFYLPNETSVKRRFLKPKAIPRYTNITGNEEQLLMMQRKKRLLNGQLPKENETLIEKNNSECTAEDLNFSDPSIEDLNTLNINQMTVSDLKNHGNDCEARLNEELCDNENEELCSEFIGGSNGSIHHDDKYENLKTENVEVTLSSFLQTKADLKTMCNIMSFEFLDKLAELLDEIYPPPGKQLLRTRDCIILTTAKLKLDIPFNALAVFYNSVSEGYVRNIFYVTLKKLATILQSIIKKVPKQETESNTTKFLMEFTETSILNCTEVQIQKPKCSKCQTKFYSLYKGQLRVKFVTEVTPTGLITFISKSFSGGTSNNKIFNHSEISRHLESRRDIIVNQGFFVDDEYIQQKIQLMKFPHIKAENQLPEENVTSRNVSRTRIYIERINKKIRQFKILENKIPWHMINYVEDVFIICYGLATLDSPI